MESNPDQWFSGGNARAFVDEARAEVATFLGSDPRNLVFVPNISSGINAILKTLRLVNSQKIMFSRFEF